MREIEPLTGLRGICALCVLGFHAFFCYPFYGGPLDWITSAGYMGVDVFFVLSGYVLAYTYASSAWTPASYFAYLRKRFARIYPMHAFMLLVFVVVIWAVARMGILLMSPQSTEWSDLVRALLLVHAWDSVERYPWNGPSWSISAEWVAYVVFPLLATAAVKIRNAAIAVGLVVLLYVLYRLLGHHPSAHLGIAWRMPHLFANFFAGVLLWRVASLTPATRHDDKIAAFALVLLTLGASASNLIAMKPVAGDRFAIVAALLVYFTARSTGPLARFLSTRVMLHLGRISYSLYLVHILFMYASDIVIQRAPEMAWPIRIAAIGLALLAAHLCYRWIEEPCRKAIARARPPVLAVGTASAT